MARKLHTGSRGGKYYIRRGTKVYIKKKGGAWGTGEQRLWNLNDDSKGVHRV